ncbi:GGDEF domain-containing protein [Thiosulfativibrio zosterae]|uniref:Diguanylate cyclase n=1 Tax=Thiosulfativibrio zosterae TaxID=2675053 RepID=A0A6F8PKM7_9GAMM|nr:GGDEF domain-containing protein [Thiosulfativibrio zosterae]BBP42550.1 hypothetical protein THMIRHAT_02960 [Thiosulfativibrio zosterae]
MKIKNQLLLALGGVFLVFMLGVWYYANLATQSLNEYWAQRLIEKQLFFDKNRTLQPILQETALAKQMAQEPALLAMALDDNDLAAREAGLAVLENYRLKFQDHSFFAAFRKTQHYFYNDADNSRQNNPLAYTLNPQTADDQWFFRAIQLTDRPYQINVNKDTVLGTTKVWINLLLKHQGEVVGIIGTGLGLDSFLKQSVDISQPGIRNLFIDENLNIQLDRDERRINLASFIKPPSEQENLSFLLSHPEDLNTIKTFAKQLKSANSVEQIKTFWSHDDGNQRLIGITYLPEIGWFNITLFEPDELVFIDPLFIVSTLSGLILLILFILFRVNHALFIQPLVQLTQSVQQFRVDPHQLPNTSVRGYSQEMDTLSTEFKSLIEQVKYTQETLEQRIQERTLALQENETKLNTILNIIPAFVFIKDPAMRFTYVNKAVQNLFKTPLRDIIGKTDHSFFNEDFANSAEIEDRKVFEKGEESHREESVLNDAGEVVKVLHTVKIPLKHENGSVYALCGIAWDITQQKQSELATKQLALYDSLTQLPNRRLLMERLQQEQTLGQRKKTYAALLFLDLDNFKPLNDNYGHDIGDQLLLQTAQRLTQAVRETDTVARFGGDEFIIILSELSTDYSEAMASTQKIVDKILWQLAEPYDLTLAQSGLQHQCTLSIGITLFKGQGFNPQQIIQHADQAMYLAKKQGRNRSHLSPFSATS